MSLAVTMAHQTGGTAQSGPQRVVTRPNGDLVTITRGFANLGSVEIFACPPTAWMRLLDALSPISVARAHTTGSPTKIGEPHVDDLLRADGTNIEVGTLKPPADRYCRATLTLDAADDDAVGLPTVVPMAGNTVWLEGTVQTGGTGAAQPFQLTSAAEAAADVAFDPSPVALQSAGTARTGRVVLRYDHWFDTVDPLAQDAGDALVSAIAQSIELRAE